MIYFWHFSELDQKCLVSPVLTRQTPLRLPFAFLKMSECERFQRLATLTSYVNLNHGSNIHQVKAHGYFNGAKPAC